jgi:hypothetical protein
MTRQEFEYIKRAVEALEKGDHCLLSQHRILRTVSQITAKAANSIKESLEETQGAKA